MALVCVAIQTAVYLPDALLSNHELHLLDADGDFSIWAWGNASTIVVGALAGVLLALTVQRPLVKVYAGIAGTLTFLSLDETVGIHERLTNDLPSLLGVPDYYARAIWPAVYLPLLATVAMLLIVAARRLAPRPARLVRLGLLLLVLAVVAEITSTVLIADGHATGSVPDTVEVAVEEGCELGGWILIASALLAGMTARHVALGRPAD